MRIPGFLSVAAINTEDRAKTGLIVSRPDVLVKYFLVVVSCERHPKTSKSSISDEDLSINVPSFLSKIGARNWANSHKNRSITQVVLSDTWHDRQECAE
jgi:hypothetical protein